MSGATPLHSRRLRRSRTPPAPELSSCPLLGALRTEFPPVPFPAPCPVVHTFVHRLCKTDRCVRVENLTTLEGPHNQIIHRSRAHRRVGLRRPSSPTTEVGLGRV